MFSEELQDGLVDDEPALDEDEATLPTVLNLLTRLLADLERLRGRRALRSHNGDSRISVWEDNYHIYIQDDLPHPAPADLDVTLHGMTLFIRMEQ